MDEFLVIKKELGFDGIMPGAKKPHVSSIDYDDAARKKLRARIEEPGLDKKFLEYIQKFKQAIQGLVAQILQPDIPEFQF